MLRDRSLPPFQIDSPGSVGVEAVAFFAVVAVLEIAAGDELVKVTRCSGFSFSVKCLLVRRS